MVQTVTLLETPQWASIAVDLGAPIGRSTLIIGDRAAEVGESFQRAGAPPAAYERADLVLLTRDPPEVDFEAATARATGFPNDSIDLVVVRHAWRSRPELGGVLAEAARVCRPAGGVLAGELDLERLVGSPAARYPSRLQFDLQPELLADFRTRTVLPTALSLELGRAGLRSVVMASIDEARGHFASVDDYLTYARAGGWRSLQFLDEEGINRLLTRAAELLPRIGMGPLVDREPWHLAWGRS